MISSENERNEKSESSGVDKNNDVFAAAKSASQVKKEDNPLIRKFKKLAVHSVVLVIIVFIVIVMFFSHGHKNEITETTNQSLTTKTDYHAELEANLAKLREANATMKAALQGSVVQNNQPYSREYLARQNAPTRMYEASASQAQSTNHSETGSAVFAGQSTLDQFGNQNTQTSDVSASKIAHPEYTIASGEFMHAILETPINSDLPGMARAIIANPVYAYVGEQPLIPAGSRLLGQYAATVFQGQQRIFVIWNRVILPSGISVQINSPGTDALGMSGQGADHINTHFFARFGEAALLSIMGAGSATIGVNGTDQDNSSSTYRSAMAESFQQSAQQSLQNTLPMKPTLVVDQGAKINVFVSHDLSFYRVLSTLSMQGLSNE